MTDYQNQERTEEQTEDFRNKMKESWGLKPMKTNMKKSKAKCCYYNEDCPICPREETNSLTNQQCCEKCFKWGKTYGEYVHPCNKPDCDCHSLTNQEPMDWEKEFRDIYSPFMSESAMNSLQVSIYKWLQQERERTIKLLWCLHKDENTEEAIIYNEGLDLAIFKLTHKQHKQT